jgi:uncharacterized protein (DUF58 family)
VPLKPDLVERLTSRALAGVGVERAPGHGDEFFGLREYVAGDPTRRIAWRASARTGALVVRQHALPAPVRVWVVLDVAGPDAFMERAIALSASLSRQADQAGIGVGLAVPSADLLISPRIARRQIDRVLGALVRLDPGAATDSRPPFPEEPARVGRGAVCVVIHAGSGDPGYGPPHARHFSAADPGAWLDRSDEAARALAFIDAAQRRGARA